MLQQIREWGIEKMKVLTINLFCLFVFFLNLNIISEDKTDFTDIYDISTLPSGKISLLVCSRAESGEWLSARVVQIDMNGRILKCLLEPKWNNRGWLYHLLGFDEEDNLWLRRMEGGTYNSVINVYKVKSNDVNSKTFNPVFQFTLPNRYPSSPQMMFFKEKMLIYPNLLSEDKGNTWTTLFKDVDFYPREMKESETMESVCNYNIYQGNIYKCTVINDGDYSIAVKIDVFDLKNKKWTEDSIISLKGKGVPGFTMDFPFLVSDKYYVLVNGNDAGELIHVYNRSSKQFYSFEKVGNDCSDADLIGITPNAIVDDLLFAGCPRGGYVVFDLKSGKISHRGFTKYWCEIIKPPDGNYLLLNCGGKLFISKDKGKKWKEIFDVKSLRENAK